MTARRQFPRHLGLALVLIGMLGVPAQARAQDAPPAEANPAIASERPPGVPGALHADSAVMAALAATPAVQAAWLAVAAATAAHAADQTERTDWMATPALARRSTAAAAGGAGGRSTEWELLLERSLRLPARRAATDRLGQARVQAARQAWQLAWRQQARALLERQAAWLRDCQSAAVWADQRDLLSRQAQAVARRQTLGDAAPVDTRQAQAALTQATTQAQLGTARCDAASTLLQAQFPGLALPDGRTWPHAQAGLASVEAAAAPVGEPEAARPVVVAAWLAASPELAMARGEARVLDAQQATDLAELRANPQLGLRLGGNSGGERVMGVQIALQFGGAAHLDAARRAQAARLVAAEADVDLLERRLGAEAGLALHEAAAAQVAWRGARLAAAQLVDSATVLARGYELGEGRLAELLAARRMAQEQQLAARLAGVAAWQTERRIALETGAAWAAPTPTSAPAGP